MKKKHLSLWRGFFLVVSISVIVLTAQIVRADTSYTYTYYPNWSNNYTYAPYSGTLQLRSLVVSNGSARYFYDDGYNMVYSQSQVNANAGASSHFMVFHAFHTPTDCLDGKTDSSSKLNATSYTYSTLPNASYSSRKFAGCNAIGSPNNEVRIFFDGRSLQAYVYYEALAEYQDTYWNGNPWNSQGYGNGDQGKMGIDQYTYGGAYKQSMAYGFFCAYMNKTGATGLAGDPSRC